MNNEQAAGPRRAIRNTLARIDAGTVILGALVLLMSGCRSYERCPLDIDAVREAWLARSPSDESARLYAERLALAEGDAAGVFDHIDGLTLAEAEPVALVFNRELRVARLESGVSRAGAEHAGQWEDPVAQVDIERIVSSVAEPWIVAGTIGLTIPLSGRLEVEKQRASAEYAAALQRLAAKEWAVRAALRELWIAWSAHSHLARLAEELVDRLRHVSDLADRQERAGVMSRIDARLFRVELARSEAEWIAARARARELQWQVRDLIGLAPDAPLGLVETLAFEGRRVNAGCSLDSLERGNLELAAVRAEYEVAEQTLRREVREQYPDLVIGPGYGTDEGTERVVLGLQLPIPLWNRNQQGVAEAEASRQLARGRFESTYERLASRLAIAWSLCESSRAVREAIETRVVPLADEQDIEVRRVAELGDVNPLLLLEAIKGRHGAKVRLVEARASEAIGSIRLDELIGPPGVASAEPSGDQP